jgi:hypothetical protein
MKEEHISSIASDDSFSMYWHSSCFYVSEIDVSAFRAAMDESMDDERALN